MTLWLLAGVFSVALTILVFLPATWLAAMVEKQSEGRLTLGDAHGTLWHGSAFIGGAASETEPVSPLLLGKFTWHISPLALLGSIEAGLENTAALSQPVKITGSWHQWQMSSATISLPAERLSALGAPLNTVKPSGQMRLSWEPLQIALQNGTIEITGVMNLEMNDLASRMSPVKPLGSYNLKLDWHGKNASVTLKTINGPMLLSGSGKFANEHLQFSGIAEADAGQEERLANFLNLLGQRHREGDKDVISLEFK